MREGRWGGRGGGREGGCVGGRGEEWRRRGRGEGGERVGEVLKMCQSTHGGEGGGEVVQLWLFIRTHDCSPLQKEWETRPAEKVDNLLESFMGIRDMKLGEVAREIHGHNLIGLPKYNAFR